MSDVAPLVKVLSPFLKSPWCCDRHELDDTLGCVGTVELIHEARSFKHDIRPDGFCLVFDLQVLPLLITVAEKRSILMRVHLFSQEQKQLLVVLKV